MSKARLVLFLVLGISSTLVTPSVGKKMSMCQKAYFMLRQCSSELSGALEAGDQCCDLLAAFDLRECELTDDRVKSFNVKSSTYLQPLRVVCNVPVPSPSAEPSKANDNDDALKQAADSISKARDSSMFDNIVSIAQAVMATDTESSRVVTVELAIRGKADDVESAVKTAVNTAAALAKSTSKKGGILLHDISLEMEREDAHQRALCACQNAELPELSTDATNLVALRYAYLAARLHICKFTCANKGWVLGGMIVQMALLGAWIVCLLARPLWAKSTSSRSRYKSAHSSSSSLRSNSAQFIANAGDSEWTQPLLAGDEEEGMASSQ